MLSKNTVIELWHELEDVPFVENPYGQQFLDVQDGWLGFPWGTTKEQIWSWFNNQFAEWGGLDALLYDNPQPDRKFRVETPDGILEVYAKHEGIDCEEDYPGVYVDLCTIEEQKAGKVVGELVCCVEYDSGNHRLQIVPYADLTADEPSFGEDCNYDGAVIPITGYGDSIKL